MERCVSAFVSLLTYLLLSSLTVRVLHPPTDQMSLSVLRFFIRAITSSLVRTVPSLAVGEKHASTLLSRLVMVCLVLAYHATLQRILERRTLTSDA